MAVLADATDRGRGDHAKSACKRAHLSSALRLVTPSFSSRWTCASFSVCGLLPAYRVGPFRVKMIQIMGIHCPHAALTASWRTVKHETCHDKALSQAQYWATVPCGTNASLPLRAANAARA